MNEDVTNSPKDWEDFWNFYDEWSSEDLEKIWNEMEEIEPLTTEKELHSKYYYDYNRNDLNRPNPFKK
ncbi:hypothetical protein SWZG_00219 [Synechococcus phage S-SKS1]|uniref:Uncharacterized protein n=1 Tax=Synechococcus phage S-SKS1 TaxID=754042 RepID=M4QPY9_9CAUD|nr:hypothetical protein SWZG_00219 [Synechococcus phage S-SKS1]AGH31725.1 hypothetical protein SWZG_00219 [Synechococcus phage S-SKS1]